MDAMETLQPHAFDAVEMGSLKVCQHCFNVETRGLWTVDGRGSSRALLHLLHCSAQRLPFLQTCARVFAAACCFDSAYTDVYPLLRRPSEEEERGAPRWHIAHSIWFERLQLHASSTISHVALSRLP
jgi:hypothetical protein